MAWPVATAARLEPRRARMRAWREARWLPRVRAAAWADSRRCWRSQTGPGRVVPGPVRLADLLLPGHIPAHEARCPAVGKTVMSAPISAIRHSAVRCDTPGMVI